MRRDKAMEYFLDRHRIDKIPQQVVVEELQRVAAHYDNRYFTAKEFDAVAVRCKATTALRAFGSWRAAIEAAGLVLVPYKKPRIDQVPEQDLFAELERIWKLLGHRPSRAEWESSSPRFWYTTYTKRFNGWQNACLKFIESKSGVVQIHGTRSSEAVAVPSANAEAGVKIPKIRKREIPLRIRLRVFHRDGFRCVACGRSPAIEVGVVLHVDHIHPFAPGGESTLENLQTLCDKCNLGKGVSREFPIAR